MLREVSESMEKNGPDRGFNVNAKIFRCSQPNCNGFAYVSESQCTICHRIITPSEYPLEATSQQVNPSSNISPPSKRSRSSEGSHFVPLNIFSTGKSGIFDARAELCCITSGHISCTVKVEGVWIVITIKSIDVQTLVFSKVLQVLFLRPRDSLRSRLSEMLKLNEFSSKNSSFIRWIILVLREPPANGPLYLTAEDLHDFAESVRQTDGYCKMQYSVDETRRLLTACGLKLPRAESFSEAETNGMTDMSTTTRYEKTPSGSFSSASTSGPSINENCKELSGPITNALDELTSKDLKPPGSLLHSSDSLNNRGDCDDLIILSEEEDNYSGPTEFVHARTNNIPVGGCRGSPNTLPKCLDPDRLDSFKFDYKPPGSTDSLTLTTSDLECLDPGALINDAIINFYLKYLYFEQLTDFQRRSTYLFNVFFYNRLAAASVSSFPSSTTNVANQTESRLTLASTATLKPSEIPLEMTAAQHSMVANWTRRVDLFSKDYIIIPINEYAHWFVGLVCYPWMAGMVSYTALYRAEAYDLCQLTEKFIDVDKIQLSASDTSIGDESIDRKPSDNQGEAFNRWRRRRLAWLRKCGVNAMPCILLFDSLPCQSRVGNLHVIRNYLQMEWNIRRSAKDGELSFNRDTIRGFSPRVPSQSNLVDCGIYLLHYVEMFFKKPVKSYTKDYFQNEMYRWFPEATVEQKRTYIQELLKRLRERTLNHKDSF